MRATSGSATLPPLPFTEPMSSPHKKAPDSASGLHVAAGNVCETLAEGFPPHFLVLESFGPSVLVDASQAAGFFTAVRMTGVFLVRDPTGRPHASRRLLIFFLHVIFLDSQVSPTPARLDRKIRTKPVQVSPESGEVTAVLIRLLPSPLPQDRSVESVDVFEAAVDSAVVRVPGLVTKTSSFPDSISLV